MSAHSESLINEYNFSQNTTTTLSTSVINWWNVCLSNKRVSLEYTENEWTTENLVLSKQYVYNYYKRTFVGETAGVVALGVVTFWSQFKQLVPLITETHNSITISTYDECVSFNTHYNSNERVSTFTPSVELEH